MRKLLSMLTMLLLVASMAVAQTRTITGKVTNEKGEPVPFASVKVKGSNAGVAADENGNFSISAKQGDVLVISATGQAPREVRVGAGSTLDVSLQAGSDQLTEVVVTALGLQKQPKELGYSVARVKSSELTQAKVTNLQNGLVGKVSGLNVQTTNNGVFANTRITLRGIRSLLGSNQPILVVDGTPMALGFINSINPNDVDAVTVLKGANASALYGPEGVNGVIMITTKRGTKGRPQISVSNTTLFETVQFMPNLQERFGSGSSYNSFGDGVYDPIENQSWGAEFDGRDTILGRPDENGNIQKVPYSFKSGEKNRFFNTGITLQNDISLSQADDRSNFYLAFQDVNIKGIVPSDKNHRTTFRANAGKTFGIVKASVNFNYTLSNYDVNNSDGPAYWYVINTPPNVPLTRYKDWQNDNWSNHNHYFNDYYPNPYENIAIRRSRGRTDNLFGNLELSVKPTSWLTVLNRLGYTFSTANYKISNGAIIYSDYAAHNGRSISGSGNEPAQVGDGLSQSRRINNEFIVTADKEFGKFSVKALGGNLIREAISKDVDLTGNNLVIPTLFNASNRTGELVGSESNITTRLYSFFGSVSLGWNDWAFVEFTGRNDWDSRLPQGANSYFYPGVAGSVILTNAIPALQSSDILSYAKLKGAWNRTGNVNAIGAYSLESTFSQGGGFPYGSLPGFTAGSRINNPAIKPEIVESFEVGVELRFLRDRIGLDVAYYNQDNNDQIVPVQISNATGYSDALLNAARFWNRGYEVDLSLTPLMSASGFVWNVRANYTYNDSKVLEVYEGLDELSVGNTAFVIKDYPAYTHKLVDWLRDDEGRVIIDPVSGYPTQNPVQTIFGRVNPKHIIGINTDLSWKGFTLRAVAEYRGGNYIYNSVGFSLGFTGIDELSALNGRQRFVFPNSSYLDPNTGKYVPNTNIVVTNAHYDFLQAGRFRNTNTNYYSSASFWKIREVVLSYDIPKNVLGSGKILKAASVSLIGRNLFTFRPDTNRWTDPEFSNTTGNAIGTTDIGQTPPTRFMGFNVNLTF